MFSLKLAFAGIWPLILDYSWPILTIAAIILLELFSGVIGTYIPFLATLLEKFRKDLLWVAVVIALCLGWGIKMQRDEKARCDAKAIVTSTQVHKAVTKSHSKPVKGAAEDDNL